MRSMNPGYASVASSASRLAFSTIPPMVSSSTSERLARKQFATTRAYGSRSLDTTRSAYALNSLETIPDPANPSNRWRLSLPDSARTDFSASDIGVSSCRLLPMYVMTCC